MSATQSPDVPALKIGAPVPAFTATGTSGEISLTDLVAGRKLVLFFYPKDNTPGCTSEAAGFSAAWQDFRDAGAEIVGVSRDSLGSHAKFREKLGIPFELISDGNEALCQLFDVIRNKNMYGRQVRGIERSTFLIDGNGILIHEWRKVKVPGHVDEVLATVRQH